MWLCFNDTFLSIVHKDCEDDELLVRARRDGDIERVFPGAVVRIVSGHDYRCRAVVKRTEVGSVLAERASGIDYPNFKNSVRDRNLHDTYVNVWTDIGALQPGGPYSHSIRRQQGRN